MAEVGTLNLDFGVKKCPNRKIIFGTFIYALWSYQNRKHPVGYIDTLTSKHTGWISELRGSTPVNSLVSLIANTLTERTSLRHSLCDYSLFSTRKNLLVFR